MHREKLDGSAGPLRNGNQSLAPRCLARTRRLNASLPVSPLGRSYTGRPRIVRTRFAARVVCNPLVLPDGHRH